MYKIILILFIFGRSMSLPMPYFSSRIYWLVDDVTRNGDWYYPTGFYGCQIMSFSFLKKSPGSEINIIGERMTLFRSKREWRWGIPMVENTWCLNKTRRVEDLGDEAKMIRDFFKKLKDV